VFRVGNSKGLATGNKRFEVELGLERVILSEFLRTRITGDPAWRYTCMAAQAPMRGGIA